MHKIILFYFEKNFTGPECDEIDALGSSDLEFIASQRSQPDGKYTG